MDFDGLIPGSVELEWNLLVGTYEYISTTPAELKLIRLWDPIKIVRDDGLGNRKAAKAWPSARSTTQLASSGMWLKRP